MKDLIWFVNLTDQELDEIASTVPCISTGVNTYIPKDCLEMLGTIPQETMNKRRVIRWNDIN